MVPIYRDKIFVLYYDCIRTFEITTIQNPDVEYECKSRIVEHTREKLRIIRDRVRGRHESRKSANWSQTVRK
jgi:hypothetical protein